MYGKIFDSMYDSTLADDWRALITFQQMIVLCDDAGTIDMTPQSIARRTGIPIEHIKEGIKILEAPDPYSRTTDHDGRRVERLDDHRPWGWTIINHNKYKMLADHEEKKKNDRERIAAKRAKARANKGLQGSRKVSQSVANVAHTDTDTDTEYLPNGKGENGKRLHIPYQKIIDLYHLHLPKLARVVKLTNKRKTAIRNRWKDDADNLKFWEDYFKYCAKSKFLHGGNERGWEASIDFLVREDVIVKTQEGKYHHE